ncbi:MAG: dCTP deaminase [Candidatus Altiarchaeales archaeon HGW-Altiarchaeales-3]|nr:MAG: dCTP deaminase [Candidatus Altiarchaeales archaeon HGW-Altiarchaeales-3]
MILGNSKILELVKDENIKLLVNFNEECLGSAGYDLRAGKIYKIISGSKIGATDRIMPDVREIPAKQYFMDAYEYILLETIEKVNMPNDLLARILNRSSLFRCGCTLATAVVDPGYCGTLTLGLKNLNKFKFEIEVGARVGQIVFETVEGDVKPYDGRYQGGKVV